MSLVISLFSIAALIDFYFKLMACSFNECLMHTWDCICFALLGTEVFY